MQIAFQLTELFQIEIDAVIYTYQFTCYNKKRPSKGWSGVHLLHDNASSRKCEVVKSFLVSEKVIVLNHPPYSPDLSSCDFFLFPRLKKMLSGNQYTSRSSLGSAIYQGLIQLPNEDYLSAFRDWVKRLQKCVSVKGEYMYFWRFVIKICLIKRSTEVNYPNRVTKLFAGTPYMYMYQPTLSLADCNSSGLTVKNTPADLDPYCSHTP